MVLNATFNNISAISWRSVLLVEETGAPEKKHRPVASHRQTLSRNVVSSTPRLSGIHTHTEVLIAKVVVNPATIRSRQQRPLDRTALC